MNIEKGWGERAEGVAFVERLADARSCVSLASQHD